MTSTNIKISQRIGGLLLAGTILGGFAGSLHAQTAVTPPAPTPTAQPTVVQATGLIRTVTVRGAQRLEPETIRAYANLNPGQTYTGETLDSSLKDLYATELFADVVISGADTGDLIITVTENPVINRIVLEGNKKIKEDKIMPEIRLAPRQIFTRSKVRSDVERIIELYKRQGRFAASVEPKIVQLDQNRVDLVFEINEGEKSKVRAINIIGNDKYSDGRLQKEMYTKEAGGLLGFFKSNDSYDPDRLAADQQKLRAFYLTQGYADFRVVSALAELTPDRRDFVITYVVEEGPRYKFGKIAADSELRDFANADIIKLVPVKEGDWFNAKAIEDTVNGLNEIAGSKGYAFASIEPNYDRDSEKHIMGITFRAADTPRVYVERIEVSGNTVTRDKVVRREFRINEGDAFNAIRVRRSQDRLQSLGFFQDKLEIKQSEGSAPDRVVLSVDVEEKSTGQLQLSAGYSSLEKIVFSGAIQQTNFLGKGQVANASIDWSRYSRSVVLGFTEPHLFDRQIALGGDIFRRDYNSFNYVGNERKTTYSQVSTGGAIRTGFPLTEYMTMGARYTLTADKITLNKDTFYTDPDLVLDPDGTGPLTGSNGPRDPQCDKLKAGQYLCDELGTRVTSLLGATVAFDNTNGIRATRGQRVVLTSDFAGLGGDVKYLRTRGDATKYKALPYNFILSAHLEGGYIHPLGKDPDSGIDPIRITDRFFGPQMRGFDIRGIGPRIQRTRYAVDGTLKSDESTTTDALGGHTYYMGRIEVEFPLTSALRSLGLRPTAYVDAGSVFKLKQPNLTNYLGICSAISTGTGTTKVVNPDSSAADKACITDTANYLFSPGYKEDFLGNSAKPRVSIGVGVNWNSPFGPLRLDVAKALIKQPGDETKFFTFNVGTQF